MIRTAIFLVAIGTVSSGCALVEGWEPPGNGHRKNLDFALDSEGSLDDARPSNVAIDGKDFTAPNLVGQPHLIQITSARKSLSRTSTFRATPMACQVALATQDSGNTQRPYWTAQGWMTATEEADCRIQVLEGDEVLDEILVLFRNAAIIEPSVDIVDVQPDGPKISTRPPPGSTTVVHRDAFVTYALRLKDRDGRRMRLGAKSFWWSAFGRDVRSPDLWSADEAGFHDRARAPDLYGGFTPLLGAHSPGAGAYYVYGADAVSLQATVGAWTATWPIRVLDP